MPWVAALQTLPRGLVLVRCLPLLIVLQCLLIGSLNRGFRSTEIRSRSVPRLKHSLTQSADKIGKEIFRRIDSRLWTHDRHSGRGICLRWWVDESLNKIHQNRARPGRGGAFDGGGE
jgi:hypothetical protein